MPSTCGSTIQLRKLREAADKRKAKKQLSLKMPVKKKPAKARTSVETTTTELGEETDLKAFKAAPKAPKSCAKGKAKRQAGPAAAEPVPSWGLQSTTEDLPPPIAKPCSGQPDASAHQEHIVFSHAPQQQTGAERASEAATPSAQQQQVSIQPAAPKHRPGWPGWPEEAAPLAQPQKVSVQPAAPKHKPGWPGWPDDPAPPAQLQQVSVQPKAHGRRPGWPGWSAPAAELSQLQPSATLQSNPTAGEGSPASAAAAAGGLEPAAIPAQEAARTPAANHNLPPQAAPASAAAPPGAPAQEPPDTRREALQMMVNAGIAKEHGALALAAVPEDPDNAEGWAMAAIEWLTTQMELRDEISDMDRAMQASLREAEQEAQAQRQRPPAEMPEEELLAHFKGSVLIPKLKESACGDVLMHPPLKALIVALLELEQKACRWYSTAGTKAFFLRLGEQCKQEAALPAERLPAGLSCKRQKVSDTASEQESTADTDARVPAAFCAFLESKAQELQHGLYQMPGTSGEVPAIFMAVEGTPEDNEVTAGEQTAEELVLDGETIVLD